MNHREVVEEDRRSRLPGNWESLQRKIEWEEAEEKARKVLVFFTAHWTVIKGNILYIQCMRTGVEKLINK